jgi:hypothetical protein
MTWNNMTLLTHSNTPLLLAEGKLTRLTHHITASPAPAAQLQTKQRARQRLRQAARNIFFSFAKHKFQLPTSNPIPRKMMHNIDVL